eukprot:1440339-Rhodomonas_salina.2
MDIAKRMGRTIGRYYQRSKVQCAGRRGSKTTTVGVHFPAAPSPSLTPFVCSGSTRMNGRRKAEVFAEEEEEDKLEEGLNVCMLSLSSPAETKRYFIPTFTHPSALLPHCLTSCLSDCHLSAEK